MTSRPLAFLASPPKLLNFFENRPSPKERGAPQNVKKKQLTTEPLGCRGVSPG